MTLRLVTSKDNPQPILPSIADWACAHGVLIATLACFAVWLGLAIFAPDVFWLIVGMLMVSGFIAAIILNFGGKQ
jgi:hypothetical protein